MLSLISALSKFVVTITPFLALPVSLLFSTHLTLLISAVFLLHYLVVATLRYVSKGLWDSISAFAEIPLLSLISCGVYYALPNSIITLYQYALNWAGPILILVEGVQLTNCIVLLGKRSMRWIEENPDNLTIVKVIVVGGSLMCYLICGYLAYKTFGDPSINVPFASFISIVITLLIVLNVLSVLTEKSVLLDAAILSVYVILCCRFAVLHYGNELIKTERQTNPASFLDSLLGNFSASITHVFSIDYLISTALSGAALFTLSLPSEILSGDEETGLETEQGVLWQIVKDALFKVLGITLYTHLILQLVGHIPTYSVMWRIAQVVLCMVYYLLSLVPFKSTHEHYE